MPQTRLEYDLLGPLWGWGIKTWESEAWNWENWSWLWETEWPWKIHLSLQFPKFQPCLHVKTRAFRALHKSQLAKTKFAFNPKYAAWDFFSTNGSDQTLVASNLQDHIKGQVVSKWDSRALGPSLPLWRWPINLTWAHPPAKDESCCVSSAQVQESTFSNGDPPCVLRSVWPEASEVSVFLSPTGTWPYNPTLFISPFK